MENDKAIEPSSATSAFFGKSASLIDPMVKLIGGAIALTYLLGFLVVSLHFAALGVSSLSVVKPLYLFAGFWTLSWPLALLGTWKFLAVCWQHQKGGWFNSRAITISYVILLVVSVASMVGMIASRAHPVFASNVEVKPDLYWIGSALFYGMLCVVHFATALATLIGLALYTDNRPLRVFLLTTSSTIGLVCSLLYVLLFSRYAFPLIPQSLGGGRPIAVNLLDAKQREPNIFVGIFQNKEEPQRVELLLDEPDYYLIRRFNRESKEQEIVRIRKEEVSGYVVVKTPVALINNTQKEDTPIKPN